jgi:uncharacterized protein YjbI with pentapeptide repeats
MDGSKTEGNDSKRTIAFLDVVKIIAGLAVFVPLMTGILQYRQSVQQNFDNSFRAVVEKLSSVNREERLASAANMGTFVKKDNKYYDEAVDILINRLSIELDYNVLNAIRASLERIQKEDYEKVIDKLLAIERNIFIQDYALKLRRDNAKARYDQSAADFAEMERQVKQQSSEFGQTLLGILKQKMSQESESYQSKEVDYYELSLHKQVISDFLSVFLGITKSFPLGKLEFFRNSMERVTMMELNLSNSKIGGSSFWVSNILDTKFDGSTIVETFFSNSTLTKSSFVKCRITASFYDQAYLRNVDFSESEFSDVFFTGSDLAGARFTGAKGLKPIYFYAAQNLDKAVFEPDFKAMLDEKLGTITEDELRNYITNQADLSKSNRENFLQRLDYLFQ